MGRFVELLQGLCFVDGLGVGENFAIYVISKVK
jgi:hypothetical protein